MRVRINITLGALDSEGLYTKYKDKFMLLLVRILSCAGLVAFGFGRIFANGQQIPHHRFIQLPQVLLANCKSKALNALFVFLGQIIDLLLREPKNCIPQILQGIRKFLLFL